MSLRVTVASEVKALKCRSRSESEPEQGGEFAAVDPKPGDLPLARLKLE